MYKIVTNGQWIKNYWDLNERNIKNKSYTNVNTSNGGKYKLDFDSDTMFKQFWFQLSCCTIQMHLQQLTFTDIKCVLSLTVVP